MKRILIIEDSKMFATMISRKIRFELEFERDIAGTLREARKLIDENKEGYFLAVVDLNLPDAPDGESVDYVLSRKIPVIVFTSQFNDEIRERMLSKNVVDYILKEGGPQVVDYLTESISRFYKNEFSKILVVDDSRTARTNLRHLLESQHFNIIEAPSGPKALALLEKHQDTKVVICDYNMPGMDGFELITRIRQNFPKSRLAIIGISGYGTGLLSVRLLKAGASDFLTKPYHEEELYCRINQNIEMLEYIETIEKNSNIDHLTGISNRRYFFKFGQKLVENAKRGNIHLTVATIDIDHFNLVNEEYGYEAGDTALIEVAQLLMRNFRSADVIARFGGEQFCVAATNMDLQYTAAVFDRICRQVKRKKFIYGDSSISITVSIGATTKSSNSIEDMLKRSEELLRIAKKKGRDRAEID